MDPRLFTESGNFLSMKYSESETEIPVRVKSVRLREVKDLNIIIAIHTIQMN